MGGNLFPVPRCLAYPRRRIEKERGWERKKGNGGVAHLFLLPRVTSRLISFHFLSLRLAVSIPFEGGRAHTDVFLHICAQRPSLPREYSRDYHHVEKECRRFCEPNENSLWPFPIPSLSNLTAALRRPVFFALLRGGGGGTTTTGI